MKYLVAGLGNPGTKYHGTRHNIGFAIVDWLAEQWGATDFTPSSNTDALTAEAMVKGNKVLLVKPQTFMNNSGEAVRDLAHYYRIKPDHTMIVYDDVDLGLADIRMAHNRGSGGHRGLQSIIDKLESKRFLRLRVGISPTDENGEVDKQTVPNKGINPFVMSQFSSEELAWLEREYPDIREAIEHWIIDDYEKAMNHLN